MCSNDKKQFYKDYYLAAGECNPQGEMPLTLLMTRIIEVATFHANSWGVGYARLIQDNQVWVLSRVTIEMTSYPKVNTNYATRWAMCAPSGWSLTWAPVPAWTSLS